MAKAVTNWLPPAALLIVTAICLGSRPLWVDEIFQLEGTRGQSVAAVLHNAMAAPGGMPLGYLAQALWLKLAGFSAIQARIPAFAFGVGTAFVTGWIARRMDLRGPVVLVCALLTPLLFRYSIEGRPYSQGLFFSTVSTALLIEYVRLPQAALWAAYTASCIGGIYSQPFALFTALAHALYLLFAHRRRLPAVCTAIAIAGVSYTPWFLASQRVLAQESWPHLMFFSLRQVSPLMILREISGGGYVCSVPLVALAVYGFVRRRLLLLGSCVAVPLILAVAADAAFHYFFAIRQLIFVLPPLLLLAFAGWQDLWNERKLLAGAAAALFAAGALVKDYRWQSDHKEDWAKATAAVNQELTRDNICVQFVPPGDALHYYFFSPELRARTCRADSGATTRLVVTSPYASASEKQAASAGRNVGNTLISLR